MTINQIRMNTNENINNVHNFTDAQPTPTTKQATMPGLAEFSQQHKSTSANTANKTDSQQHQEQDPNNVWFFFINNPRTTLLAIIGILMAGIFGLFNINIEANPEVNQPIGVIQTVYPNSSATDVETEVTVPIEDQVALLSDVKEISSTSINNLSSVFVTFESNANPDDVIVELREAANKAIPKLPTDAETPQVLEFDFNNQPVVSLSVIGPQSKAELSEIAEQIQDEIETISGVSSAEISGELQQEVSIIVDRPKLEQYNLPINQVIQTISQNNVNIPLGSVKKDTDSVNLRLRGKVETIEALRAMPVSNNSQSEDLAIVTLNDIATVAIVNQPETTQAFVNPDNKSGSQTLPAINLNVFKSNGGNIVNIANSVDAKVAEINETLPANTEIIKTTDNAFFIKNDLRTLTTSGVQTIFIIFLALLLVLSFKESFIAALAIPLIFLIALAAQYFTGQTLNGLTIFSLILSLGLVVDTSIVIVEGIFEARQHGLSTQQAAYHSVATYKGPLIAGTLTTVAAFFPLLLVSGIVGDFIKTIPIVLTITLTASLFVSIAISPLLASKLISDKQTIYESPEPEELTLKQRAIETLKDWYQGILNTILESRILRISIVLVTIVLFFASFIFPVTGMLQAQLFPVVDTPFLYLNAKAPKGSELEETRALLQPVEAILQAEPAIENYIINIGRSLSTQQDFGAGGISADQASIILNLTDINKTDRPESFEIADVLREQFAQLNTPLEVTVEAVNSGPPVSAPLGVQINGTDIDTLRELAETLTNQLKQIDGLVNIETSFDETILEASLLIDNDRSIYYGLSNGQIAQIIQTFTNGTKVGTLVVNGDDTDIRLYMDERITDLNTTKLEDIHNVPILTQRGTIPLNQVAEIRLQESLDSIPRLDQKRNVSITGNTEKDVLIQSLQPQIQAVLDNLELPTGYEITTGGEDEDIQQSFTELFRSMSIAVLLILTILVVIFNSFRQTIIVLMTIPLAIIGIFPGLSLLGLPLSFPAFLGVVMLTGIVVNDAIVLMDQINRNRAEGQELNAAISNGARSRLVPIMLTSITTILGLLPITISDAFWRGLGFSVIFGLLTATLLTLIIIPILYRAFYYKQT